MNSKTKYVLIIAVLLFPLGICGRALWIKMKQARKTKQEAYWKVHTWPAETKQTLEKVKARQAVNETHNAITIDLKPYITAKLTEAPFSKKRVNINNLEELPIGTNIYAGVPFDVEGTIHLMGNYLHAVGKKYPSEVDSITINRKCEKIHLLHSACYVPTKDYGTTVAKMVVHYEDGSSRVMDMVTGQQVFEWWGVTYHTGVPEVWWKWAPNTELAWVGTNACVRRFHMESEALICLYRTSFENPQPGVAVSSLDYVSTMTMTCPFLVGLTVE